jgi:hypothetical protein
VKLIKELHALVWTIAGILLVLITLSGPTLTKATVIFVVGLIVHFLGVLLSGDDNIEDT